MRISDWSSDVCSSDLHDHMNALAAGEHGKADKAQIGQLPFHIHCRFSHHIEVEALVRVKIPNHTIGLFHLTGERTHAVNFSSHLQVTRGDALSTRDIKEWQMDRGWTSESGGK